jgi:adenylate kinase
MMIGITGTPGTGKSSVAEHLRQRGYTVVVQNDTIEDFMLEYDSDRNSQVIDEDRWAEHFIKFDGFIEGHLTHLLPCDRVVVLRCRPEVLAVRLAARGYSTEKIEENCEAEALDVILIETMERHPWQAVLELDTTGGRPSEYADVIEAFIQGKHQPSHGTMDWSQYLMDRL